MRMDSRRAFRAYSASISVVDLAATVFVASHEHTTPNWRTVLLFGVLIVISQHRLVDLSDGMYVNADFMIMMAAIVVFHDQGGPLLGPMLVLACRGPELRHIRSRSWALMACNSATGVIAVLAAALTFSGFNVDGGGVSLLAIVAAVITSFVCVGVMGITLAPALDRKSVGEGKG